jgi:hypothetical protein
LQAHSIQSKLNAHLPPPQSREYRHTTYPTLRTLQAFLAPGTATFSPILYYRYLASFPTIILIYLSIYLKSEAGLRSADPTKAPCCMHSPSNCTHVPAMQIADKNPTSVLPPPPRYPSQAAYNLAVANGQAAPMIETNNILSHPTGPEYQLVVGEGRS